MLIIWKGVQKTRSMGGCRSNQVIFPQIVRMVISAGRRGRQRTAEKLKRKGMPPDHRIFMYRTKNKHSLKKKTTKNLSLSDDKTVLMKRTFEFLDLVGWNIFGTQNSKMTNNIWAFIHIFFFPRLLLFNLPFPLLCNHWNKMSTVSIKMAPKLEWYDSSHECEQHLLMELIPTLSGFTPTLKTNNTDTNIKLWNIIYCIKIIFSYR